MVDLTSEELAALPVGSVIYCERLGKTASKQYATADGTVTSFLEGVYPFFLAATVLDSDGPFRLISRPDPEMVKEYERFSLECAELCDDLTENMNEHLKAVVAHSSKVRAAGDGSDA